MEIFRFLVFGICNPIRNLVGWLLGIQGVEAVERLQMELHFLTSRNNELNDQNEALIREVRFLSRSNEILELKFEKIQQQLCSELEGSGSYVDGSATPLLLESTLNTLHVKVSCLAKLFVDLITNSGLGHELALMTHFKGIYLTRPAHVNYLLKAWIYSVLFENFENESFLPGGATLFLDPDQRKMKCFEYFQRIVSSFSNLESSILDSASEAFFRRKLFHFLVFWQSWFARQGNNQGSVFFQIDGNFSLADLGALQPRTRMFIEGFVSAVNIVWAVHKLCLSFEPCAHIFRVEQLAEFREEYMDSVVSIDEDLNFVPTVGFMISPGVCLRRSVVKCQIYLHGVHSA